MDSPGSQEIRGRFPGDPYRPSYHFTSPSNFMKDPNGTIYWNGRYHLFYQYNPDGAYDDFKRMHWGHASSADLLYWADHPIALAPTSEGPDRLGCCSGAAFDMDGVPALIYYGNPGGICIVTSDDSLIDWGSHPANPVIPRPPDGTEEWGTWDPCAWKEGEDWYSLSGGVHEGRDTAFLFKSKNLADWQYIGMLYEPGKESDCSVPDFFQIGDRHMLLFASHERGVQYYIGNYVDQKFFPKHHGRMNFGEFTLESGHLCAGLTLKAPDGRRIMVGWVTEGRSEEVQKRLGWSGVMSLPRELSLAYDGTLVTKPARELKALRNDHRQMGSRSIADGSRVSVGTIRGGAFESVICFDVGGARKVGLEVLSSPGGEESTVITYSPESGHFVLDAERSSLSDEVVGRGVQTDYLRLGPDNVLTMHVFVDRSIVEVFTNSQVCLTKRVYASRHDSTGVYVFAEGGDARLVSLDAWDISSIW